MLALTVPESVTILSAFGTGFFLGTAATLVLLRVLIPSVLKVTHRITSDMDSDAEETSHAKPRRNKNSPSE